MRRKPGISPKELQARDFVIRTVIGQTLSAQYHLAEPLSDRLVHLLKCLEAADDIGDVETERA